MPSAVPPSFGDAALALPAARVFRVRCADGPWRSALPCIAGALRRSLLGSGLRLRRGPSTFGPEAPGSIRRRRRPDFHQPPGLSADARRVLVPFIARLRDVGGVCGEVPRGVKRRPSAPSAAHVRCSARPEGSGSAGTADPSPSARTGGTWSLAASRRSANGGTSHTGQGAGRSRGDRRHVAERVGFEPTKSLDSALFKSAAINRSATSPAARVAAARGPIARPRFGEADGRDLS